MSTLFTLGKNLLNPNRIHGAGLLDGFSRSTYFSNSFGWDIPFITKAEPSKLVKPPQKFWSTIDSLKTRLGLSNVQPKKVLCVRCTQQDVQVYTLTLGISKSRKNPDIDYMNQGFKFSINW